MGPWALCWYAQQIWAQPVWGVIHTCPQQWTWHGGVGGEGNQLTGWIFATRRPNEMAPLAGINIWTMGSLLVCSEKLGSQS